jgi:hypothetical protein
MPEATCVDCGDKYDKEREGSDGMCGRCVPSDEPLPWDVGLDIFAVADDRYSVFNGNP